MPKLDQIVSLTKRRGFIFQGSEVYGGLRSVWDFGPLGIELKRRVKEMWWHHIIQEREDVEGIDSAMGAAVIIHRMSWSDAESIEEGTAGRISIDDWTKSFNFFST